MSGETKRPRGRPRKDASAVSTPLSTPVAKPKAVQEIVDEEAAPSSSDSSRRYSPRKRKPANFDGFIVETPGKGIVAEDDDLADIIDEIEEEDPVVEELREVKAEAKDDDFKPGIPTPTTVKRKYTKRKKPDPAGSEGALVRMDDIEEDLDDPMRRVERRGRKKKKPVEGIEPAPILVREKKFPAPPPVVRTPAPIEVKEAEAVSVPKEESVAREAAGEEESQPNDLTTPSSPRKSPRGSPVKIPAIPSTPTKTTGVSRRKQDMTMERDDDEEEEYIQREEIVEEEVPEEDMMEEDLVDVESFEVSTMPRMAIDRLHNKPFRCTDCGAGYRREAYLLNHLANVHRDQCAILSSAERSAKRAVRRPERFIPRERPGEAAYKFGCDLCERRFLRWEGLVVHQKQIHKEVTPAAKDQEKNRDYGAKCPVCLLYFFGNHALSEHVSKVHPNHNRFIFACDICGMGFMHWARVRAHKTQIHNAPVKYTQGYLKKNPEMAKIVEAQRMRKAVERNRAKRMLEKGILSTESVGREEDRIRQHDHYARIMSDCYEQIDYSGLSRSEMAEYMYLMPPTLEPEMEGEMYEDDDDGEEIVEEEGIIDAHEMMNIRMVPLPPSSVRRPPLPPRMMGYREYRDPRGYAPSHHQLSSLHQRLNQRVTQLDRRDLEILNRRNPPMQMNTVRGVPKEEEEDLEIDVERDEEMIEEEVVDDEMIMEEEEEMRVSQEEQEQREGEEGGVEDGEEGEEDQVPPQLDMYA